MTDPTFKDIAESAHRIEDEVSSLVIHLHDWLAMALKFVEQHGALSDSERSELGLDAIDDLMLVMGGWYLDTHDGDTVTMKGYSDALARFGLVPIRESPKVPIGT